MPPVNEASVFCVGQEDVAQRRVELASEPIDATQAGIARAFAHMLPELAVSTIFAVQSIFDGWRKFPRNLSAFACDLTSGYISTDWLCLQSLMRLHTRRTAKIGVLTKGATNWANAQSP